MLKTLFARPSPKAAAEPAAAPSPSAWSIVTSAIGGGGSPKAVDWSDWEVVQVDVPPGPLGIVLDGACPFAGVLEEFCELPDGRRGPVELHGGVPVGSVLMSVNEFELLAARKTMAEVGDVLRESAHLRRVLRFKVPPTAAPVEPSASGAGDKQSLLGQLLALSGVGSSSSSGDQAVDDPAHTKHDPVALKAAAVNGTPAPLAVTVRGPTLAAPSQPLDERFVAVDAPPGPLGLNLDGDEPERAVVLGFAALPGGGKGAIELHGGVTRGAVLVEVNGESVVKLPLDAVRSRLAALSTEPRRLVFRRPESARQQSARALQATRPKPARAASVRVRVTEDLPRRRRLELALVMRYDQRAIKRGECWFLIDAAWMQRWVAFVAQGGPLPGPIDNDALLRPQWRERLAGELPGDAGAPREGLTTPAHYRCVGPMVWSLLAELHGPGDAPPLARYVTDIYAEIVDGEDIAAVLRGPQPTALALAQELLAKCRIEDIES